MNFLLVISVCIPIFNFDVAALVKDLQFQSEQAGRPYEIILIDDGSEKAFQNTNSTLSSLPNCRYLQLSENIGRAAIRNRFDQLSQYPFLLFLDCDSAAPPSFIKNYLCHINESTGVIVGGRAYYADPPEDHTRYLRWYYGLNREQLDAAQRQQKPYQSFMTCNFLIKKQLLQSIRFDERLRHYGHEDTLFGYQLKLQQVSIRHINNPLYHIQLEECSTFLEKTRKGVKNLNYILDHIQMARDFREDVKLLKAYDYLQACKLTGISARVFHLLRPRLEKLLCNKKPKLWHFDLYKLGYLCTISNVKEKY